MDFNTLGSFDANQHTPKQLGGSVPPGKYPFQISSTEIKPTNDGKGGNFIVEFSTPSGVATKWYNLWPSPDGQNPAKTAEIAHGQLSALCHATGIFKVNYATQGAELRGGMGMVEIGFQKGQEPTPEKPEGGYTEVKRVFDKAGNEPGKPPANAPQVAQQGNGAAWGGQPAASAAQGQAPQQWGATQGAPIGAANPPPATPAWQPGPTQPPANVPPWANK